MSPKAPSREDLKTQAILLCGGACGHKTDNTDPVESWSYESKSGPLVCRRGIGIQWLRETLSTLPEVRKCWEFDCPLWFFGTYCIPIMLASRGITYGTLAGHIHHFGATDDDVGGANVVLSCPDTYTLRQFLTRLKEDGEFPEHCFVWNDLFCVNQFYWQQSREELRWIKSHVEAPDVRSLVGKLPYTELMLGYTQDPLLGSAGQLWALWGLSSSCAGKADLLVVLEPPEDDDQGIRIATEANQQVRAQINASVSVFCRKRLESGHESAGLLHAIGWVKRELGHMEESERLYREAVKLYRNGGRISSVTLKATAQLSLILYKQGKNIDAELFLRDAIEGQPQATCQVFVGRCQLRLGRILHDKGDLAHAQQRMRYALRAMRAVLGDKHPDTLKAIDEYGILQKNIGNFREAEELNREAIAGHAAVFGYNHATTFKSKMNLGKLLEVMGRFVEAGAELEEVLNGFTEILGPEHTETLAAMASLAELRRKQGLLESAETMGREAHQLQTKVLGGSHIETLTTLMTYGNTMVGQGKVAEAIELLQRALSGYLETMGEDHPMSLTAKNNLANALKDQGRFDEAGVLFAQVLATRRRIFGNSHIKTLISSLNLGILYMQLQTELHQAYILCQNAYTGFSETLGSQHPHTRTAADALAYLSRTIQSDSDAATGWFRSEHQEVLIIVFGLAVGFIAVAFSMRPGASDRITLLIIPPLQLTLTNQLCTRS